MRARGCVCVCVCVCVCLCVCRGESEILLGRGIFLLDDGNLRRSDFDQSNLSRLKTSILNIN